MPAKPKPAAQKKPSAKATKDAEPAKPAAEAVADQKEATQAAPAEAAAAEPKAAEPKAVEKPAEAEAPKEPKAEPKKAEPKKTPQKKAEKEPTKAAEPKKAEKAAEPKAEAPKAETKAAEPKKAPAAAQSSSLKHPMCKWAESNEAVFLTIEVPDVKDPAITITEDTVSFEANGYRADLKLKATIDEKDEKTKYAITAREVVFHLVKKKSERWHALLADKNLGRGTIRFDFEKLIDSDDEGGFDMGSFGGGGGGGFPGMGGMGGGGFPGMEGLGGMGGMGGMGGDDSDEDEEPPAGKKEAEKKDPEPAEDNDMPELEEST
jgi:chemotaxis protein histidine kinase CheA